MDTAALPLSAWLARLETISPREIDLGLDRVARVLERLELPPAETVFHVAGTNGKGSSVAMLESLQRARGARVGCYTSPHILLYNERIRIDGIDASDQQIVSAFERIEEVREGEELTYFEFGTLAALIVFADAGVDTQVLEIGMGGRLDAVNAVEPTAGLITNVGLDHCAWLGEDVETIAFEKAGIMRPGKIAVFGSHDVPKSVTDHAATIGARLLTAGRDFDWDVAADSWSWQGREVTLDELRLPALVGEHQVANAAGVLALLEASGMKDLLKAEIINRTLSRVQLDGRIQTIDAATCWIVDVAHNPDAAAALAKGLEPQADGEKTIAILGMLDDKDVEGVVAHLHDEIDYWIAVAADSPRTIPADELARRIANASDTACLVADSVEVAMARAEELAGPHDRVLVTGSFYLVGPALDRLYSRR
ncbi:MAG: bifunctional tetrahydrofolate synthase/dihydrofolate synthase [Woeseiaceae bacterium]|nr:bifunctional tetrahydrofolate synthase/dihydrofolate synthase [Woeseiaceae bacterium]NIP22073.1 bifunctional tetrahydrofolate synthase/dihydrofolate synthase [Woeseiaceae bacterium]NIS91187.1 bifunctional tetrahydrofolate synthase/dihydrofolate synthase [Woeseiaceae bacterium]